MTPKVKKLLLYCTLALAGVLFCVVMFLVGLVISLVNLVIKLDNTDPMEAALGSGGPPSIVKPLPTGRN